MTRAYIRLDPSFDERKCDYPDGAYAALVAAICLAEHQPQRGRFRSGRYLAGLLGKRGRWVKYLVDHGDLVPVEGERLYLDGWDEWQEGDWKVAERVHRIRTRTRGTVEVTPAVTVGVTVPVTPAVTVDRYSVSAGGSAGGSNSGSNADGRADLEAFLVVRRRPPTTRQRRVMDDYLVLFDETGPERAARLILSHPDDPIGAIVEDMESHRKLRLDVATQEEAEAAQRRREQRKRALTKTQDELMAEWARQQADKGAA